MKAISLLALPSLAYAAVQGFDISNWQPTVDYDGAYASGARFAMIKATEGTTYIDPLFNTHYPGATSAGLIRGGYHFAHPDSSSGSAQASYFLAHGGGWSADGLTLPGMLDLEAGCYGLSPSAMTSWIRDFGETYKDATGRYPMIYTTTSWWTECTANNADFGDYPLVLARWASSPGTLPASWDYYSFWQNSDQYAFGGDSQVWNGSEERLRVFASG
ncbi:lysozyme [Aspergillus mulundensis]|uniref:Lysozyme n=1 Tax=Aspergillus mulundensis TaxID=1810919 RepID=A0A3D8QS25_9EURO|nr:Lysozyme [Aspergillus mulundensis]RDW64450.1 Lysozyme [Aspergillus mulundensis]